MHASAVLLGARAVLIRGPSGAGKSRLALDLLGTPQRGELPFARLVGDDRIRLEAQHGRLLVRPAEALEGMLEVRGIGILQLPFEPVAVVGWVIELAEPSATRMPASAESSVEVEGVNLPRLALPACAEPLSVLLAFARIEAT